MFSFFAACTFVGTFYLHIFAKDTTFAEDDGKVVQEDVELTKMGGDGPSVSVMSTTASTQAPTKRLLTFKEKQNLYVDK